MRWLVLLAWLSGAMTMAADVPAEVREAIQRLESTVGGQPDGPVIVVDPASQTLYLLRNGELIQRYPVSTATAGLGCRDGSYQTPVGVHRICAKIGDGAPMGEIFRARRDTGKRATIYTDPVDVPEDHVTTRILRLEGMEPGLNRGKGVDSFRRYIYIHGTPEEGLIGTPASHGCIRMKNADVIDLFNRVPTGTLVVILDRPYHR